MITIPIVIKWLYFASHIIILGFITALSVHDVRHKRVSDQALMILLPICVTGATFQLVAFSEAAVAMYYLKCLLGALIGGGLLLISALITKGGIGGGDIKTAAILGFFYGPYGILAVLLLATLSATVYGIIKRGRDKGKQLHIAFIPFVTAGCFIISAIILKGVFLP